MKLYTENDLKRAMKRAYLGGMSPFNLLQVRTEILEQLTPIEIPSDEEIKQEAESLYPLTGHVGIDHRNHLRKKGFIDGMEWMRDKIQGGNK